MMTNGHNLITQKVETGDGNVYRARSYETVGKHSHTTVIYILLRNTLINNNNKK